MAIRKIIFLLSIFALFCFHPFVSVAEERPFSLNFWPFFQYFSDPIQGTKEIGGLGPFFSWKKDPQRRQWGIRPLLYWTEDEKESLRRLEYIYPLGKYQVKDGEKKKGFHFWPIYGRRETFGISKSEFFLWPVFLKQTTGMDTDDPVEERMIFPFYLSKESIHFESKTFLWPFFFHARDRLTGFEQLDLPWPFFQSLKGEILYGINFFPFYGYKEGEGDMKRIFVLYPLYQWEEDQMRETEERSHRILLLMRIRSGEDRQGVKKESSIRVWPFFDYERESTGHTTFSFFYLFPFKDEGFERNLFPLFRVFRWEEGPQEGKEGDLFWGFYKRIEREGYDFWEIAHLIGVKRGEASKP